MNILNTYFSKVYCITCFKDVGRQETCRKQFDKYGIDFEFILAVDACLLKDVPIKDKWSKGLSAPELSLTLAHKTCVQKAKLHGFEKITIFEDDFMLYSDWEDRFVLFANELPNVWSLLYLGQPEWVDGIYDTQRLPYSTNVSICKYGCASHFLGIHESAYDTCLERFDSLRNPVDLYYGDIQHETNTCYTPPSRSFADSLSIPHEIYWDRIKNFNKSNYISSTLRDSCLNP